MKVNLVATFAEKQTKYTGGCKGGATRKWKIYNKEQLELLLRRCDRKPSKLAKLLETSYASTKRWLVAAGLWHLADIRKTKNSGGRKRTTTEDKCGYLYASKEHDIITDTGERKRRLEHRVNAEKLLGRPLKGGEMVHHINLDKQDNRLDNLYVCDNSTHKKIHHDLEALAGRLMQEGYIEFIPELEQYIFTGPRMKAEKQVANGFIKVIDTLGSDVTTVNAARVSFGNHTTTMRDKDKKLIKYLAEHQHTSPFRHSYVQFHIKAPEFVARQWYKHIVGAEYSFKDQPWNEISGRYIEYEHEFWKPEYFRKQSLDNKQASDPDSIIDDNAEAIEVYSKHVENAYKAYKLLIEKGVAKEQARAILPVSFYTEWYWTASLQTLAHFVNLRDHAGAQIEIMGYARAIDDLMYQFYPNCWKELRKGKRHF